LEISYGGDGDGDGDGDDGGGDGDGDGGCEEEGLVCVRLGVCVCFLYNPLVWC